MGPICVVSAPGGPHIGPMNIAIRVYKACMIKARMFVMDNFTVKGTQLVLTHWPLGDVEVILENIIYYG